MIDDPAAGSVNLSQSHPVRCPCVILHLLVDWFLLAACCFAGFVTFGSGSADRRRFYRFVHVCSGP